MIQSALLVENLHCEIGRGPFALGPLTYNFAPGKMHALIGRNGAGKTTLLRCLAGLEKSCTGTVTLGDATLSPTKVAWAPARPHVASMFTVHEVLMFGRYPRHLGHPTRDDHTAVTELLERMQCRHLAERRLANLSSGELQKILIARALVMPAPVYLFDEPTTSLDVSAAREIMKILQNLAQIDQAVVIFTSHDLALVEDFADQVLGLAAGTITKTWSRPEFTHSELARFF